MGYPTPRGREAARYVVEAIAQLEDSKGSSPEQITDYICKNYDVSEGEIKRYVNQALTRGVEFGAITRNRGLYKVGDVMDYATSHRRRRKKAAAGKNGGGKRRRRRRH